MERYIVCGMGKGTRITGTDWDSCSKKNWKKTPWSSLWISYRKSIHQQQWTTHWLICVCSESKWSSDLLRSSKTIGRPKQSAREQLRQAFLEQKAGVNITDTSNARLLVEREIDEEEENNNNQPSAIASSSSSSSSNNNKAAKPQQPQSTPVVGSALKQTDGTPAMPLTKRKRKKKQVRK